MDHSHRIRLGLIARFLVPGPNNPSGFILTVVLGIVGSFLATFIGQAIGWYRPTREPVSSPQLSAPPLYSLYGIGSSRAASFLIPARVHESDVTLARDVDSVGPGGEGGIQMLKTNAVI